MKNEAEVEKEDKGSELQEEAFDERERERLKMGHCESLREKD